MFSIITINLNNLKGLVNTTESVIKQKFENYEFIVIDGNSKDGSKDYIESMRNYINHYISETDNGVYHAMNKGVNLATGEFVLFLNSGDCFSNESVLFNVHKEIIAQEYENVLFVGSTIQININKQHNPPEVLSLNYLFNQALPHQGMFIPLELCRKFPYIETYKSASDWYQTLEFLRNNVKYSVLKSINYVALNEEYGISAGPIYLAEKHKMIQENYPLFYGFQELKQKSVYIQNINNIRKFNLINKFLWKIMLLISKTK